VRSGGVPRAPGPPGRRAPTSEPRPPQPPRSYPWQLWSVPLEKPEGEQGEAVWLSSDPPPQHVVFSTPVGVNYASWRLEVGLDNFPRQRRPVAVALGAVLSLSLGIATFVILGLRARHTRLLHSLLPPAVLSVRRDDDDRAAQTHSHVVTLFADICQYTEMSAGVDPTEVLRFINVLFAAFDRVCAARGLLKLDTIADAYVAVGMPLTQGPGPVKSRTARNRNNGGRSRHSAAKSPVKNPQKRGGTDAASASASASARPGDPSQPATAGPKLTPSQNGPASAAVAPAPAERAPARGASDTIAKDLGEEEKEALAASLEACADAAFDFIGEAVGPQFRGLPVQIRVGLHVGPVVSGVIGDLDNRPKWTMLGDTMNVGSRMESTGCPSRVQCSEDFADLFEALHASKAYRFTPRSAPDGSHGLEVKGRGIMKTFWLERAGGAPDGWWPVDEEAGPIDRLTQNLNPEEVQAPADRHTGVPSDRWGAAAGPEA